MTGAVVACPFGTVPGNLNVTSQQQCLADGKPIATIKDMQANSNVSSFGMCTSMANPQVASATAAALGVLTPQPCMLMAAGTWLPTKPAIMAAGTPCLCSDSQLICTNGLGVISVKMPGQMKVVV